MTWVDPFKPKRPVYDWDAHNKRLTAQRAPNPAAPAPIKPASPNQAAPAPSKPNAPIDPSIRRQAEDRYKRGTTWEQEEWERKFGGTPDAKAQARAQRLAQIAQLRRYYLDLADKTPGWAREHDGLENGYFAYRRTSTIAHNLKALNQYEQHVRNGGDIDFDAYNGAKAAENGGHIPESATYQYYDINKDRINPHYNFDPTDPRNAPLWGINN